MSASKPLKHFEFAFHLKFFDYLDAGSMQKKNIPILYFPIIGIIIFPYYWHYHIFCIVTP